MFFDWLDIVASYYHYDMADAAAPGETRYPKKVFICKDALCLRRM
jgi:hypothetical protein